MSDWAATSGYAHDLVMRTVAWLFVIAGFMKLINLQSFREAVIGYRIVPVPVSTLVAFVLPPVEVGLGFVLLGGWGGAAVPIAMLALLMI